MDIKVITADITQLDVDAVVNAANSSLMGGGGVDGAIHRAGGSAILAECKELRASSYKTGLPPGEAVATTAGNLPARWVIHTVGPVYSKNEDRSKILENCYLSSLKVAQEIGAKTVAFPTISAGVYGWPIQNACDIAVQTVKQFNVENKDSIETVVLVAFSEEARKSYEKSLGRMTKDSM